MNGRSLDKGVEERRGERERETERDRDRERERDAEIAAASKKCARL